MIDRRRFLSGLSTALGGMAVSVPRMRGIIAVGVGAGGPPGDGTAPTGDWLDESGLIRRSSRPPNYETPLDVFELALTPNERFFVRYHLGNIPAIDSRQWTLRLGGPGLRHSVSFTLDQLRRDFPSVTVEAVCACAGNGRRRFTPRVPGVQWDMGAMGNARWTGVPLKHLLARSGLRSDAVEVTFDGADAGLLPKTPDFIKCLPLVKALDDNTLVALEMNGQPLPQRHGAPARLVVPGWTATYWVKHLSVIEAVMSPYEGFWMRHAYRLPRDAFASGERFMTQDGDSDRPVTSIALNALITSLRDGEVVSVAGGTSLRGIAWDGGRGIRSVEVSTDGGQHWGGATLGDDTGRYAWRRWRCDWRPDLQGQHTLMVRATNASGETQPLEPVANPAGYHYNAVQRLTVMAA